ncbi:hypothetical protein GF359_02075 [candidate division WOR-3 bacterium]|uniref:Uncharacterized protein n=1 Tax=candidate division WOR-3 bacterium TaxID=2052148 RepID=A0A9D5K9Y5_UNCW3|nr:hypothetical protein [candidate division WOR-3 bacterium]MBD3363981.1 hypothetical protein [candidate division WOR-3 bacterium]
MRILDIFKPREKDTPEKIIEIAVFSLGSAIDLYVLSAHLAEGFGTPAWERFAGRRSLVFILDEGEVASEIPYKLTARLFEEGGGYVKLELDLHSHKFDVDSGILWHRREFSSILTRFLQTALRTDDLEALRSVTESRDILRQLGIEPERLGGELNFGFDKGSILIKVGPVPDAEGIIKLGEKAAFGDGIIYLESGDTGSIPLLERWCYREGASSWHLSSLGLGLEYLNQVRSNVSTSMCYQFARFLRRINRFILKERRFPLRPIDMTKIESSSEFNNLVSDFDSTSRRLSELLLARREGISSRDLYALRRLITGQGLLAAALVLLVGFAGLFFGLSQLILHGLTWPWIAGLSALLILPGAAYLIWVFVRRGKLKRREESDGLKEINDRLKILADYVESLEADENVPEDFREELVAIRCREINRLKYLVSEVSKNPGRDF